jgi:hypothetical protein
MSIVFEIAKDEKLRGVVWAELGDLESRRSASTGSDLYEQGQYFNA